MLYLLLIPLLTQALEIHDTDCVNYWCKYYLHFYLQRLDITFQNRKEGNEYITTINQSAPELGIASLYVKVYTITPTEARTEVSNLSLRRIGNRLVINISLQDEAIREDDGRCSNIGAVFAHTEYECTFSIEYTSRIQSSPVKTYIYKMVVEVPFLSGFSNYATGYLIDEKISRFIEEPQYEVRMYRGSDCNQEITSPTILNRWDFICIGVFGIDITMLLRHLDITFLIATYTSSTFGIRSFDMLSNADIRRSLDGRNAMGRVHAIFQTNHLGRLKISMVITPREKKRTRIESPEGIVVGDLWWDDDFFEISSAASVVVPLITFLCLLVAL